jgi:hypothetical protein
MRKTDILWFVLEIIFLIIFNIYFFMLKGVDQTPSVWISYGSIHFAYLMLLLTPLLVRKGSRSTDYEGPLYIITKSYFFLALIIGVLFIIRSSESITAAILVQLTLAAVFIILLLFNLIANENTADNIQSHEIELKYVKESSSKLNALIKQIPDNKIQKKVEKAYDIVHSSQVKSSSRVQSIELNVIQEIGTLEKAVKQRNFEIILACVDNICNMAEERNRQLKL